MPGGQACQDVLKNLSNPYYLSEQPALTGTTGWVDAWTSTPSVYAMAAKTTRDVGSGEFRAREQPAPGREGRRAQLRRNIGRARFAADMDAGDERRRAARRLCREGMPGSAGAGRIALINASGNLRGILGP